MIPERVGTLPLQLTIACFANLNSQEASHGEVSLEVHDAIVTSWDTILPATPTF